MRISFYPTGTAYEDPEGAYETPVESELLHRFRLVNGAVVDRYEGLDDEGVRERDRTDPFPPDPPVEPPAPQDPPPGQVSQEQLQMQLAEQIEMNIQQQQQLDDLTQMILEA